MRLIARYAGISPFWSVLCRMSIYSGAKGRQLGSLECQNAVGILFWRENGA